MQHLSLDLLDGAACADALGSLRNVTHIVYTAMTSDDIGRPDYMAASIAANSSMLEHVLRPLAVSSCNCTCACRHVPWISDRTAWNFRSDGAGRVAAAYFGASRSKGIRLSICLSIWLCLCLSVSLSLCLLISVSVSLRHISVLQGRKAYVSQSGSQSGSVSKSLSLNLALSLCLAVS
eukprot:SAG31_NODE_7417_length_1694_cov_2.388715_3_plen_178_part_00